MGDPVCDECVEDVRKSLITATAAACVCSHFLMGIFGNLPLAVAPAMGLNAYFAYTVVGFMGTGRVTYGQALSAVFVEGFIFIIVSVIGLRSYLVQILPRSIMLSTSAGIGLFLAHIGLQGAEGLGIVTYEPATLVTLGGCALEDRRYQYSFSDATLSDAANVCAVNETSGDPMLFAPSWVKSPNYSCASKGVMRSAQMWLGIGGGMLMAILMAKSVKGSMIIGILFVTFIR